MKKLMIVATAMLMATACCNQQNCQDTAACQSEHKCKDCKGEGHCTDGKACADGCQNGGECKHQCLGQCGKEGCKCLKFVEANCPATPLNVASYSDGLQHIGLPTAEVQKTIDFYAGLGFTLATRHDIGGRDFAFMQLGNLMIEVIPNDNPTLRTGAVDHICLNVTNIEELFEKVKAAGYTMIDQQIVDIAFWDKGARYFFIEGPNKERIEFCEIVK